MYTVLSNLPSGWCGWPLGRLVTKIYNKLFIFFESYYTSRPLHSRFSLIWRNRNQTLEIVPVAVGDYMKSNKMAVNTIRQWALNKSHDRPGVPSPERLMNRDILSPVFGQGCPN
jgi:hypothetical protein